MATIQYCIKGETPCSTVSKWRHHTVLFPFATSLT